MPGLDDDRIWLSGDIVRWIRAVYELNGWSVEERYPTTAPVDDTGVDPTEIGRRRKLESLTRAAVAIRASVLETEVGGAAPPGSSARRTVDALLDAIGTALGARDDRLAEQQVKVLVRALKSLRNARALAGAGEGEEVALPFEDEPLGDFVDRHGLPGLDTGWGCLWHAAAQPGDGSSNMGVRLELKEGVIAGLRISGRPRGKHGGKQGQHTTAFTAVRESVVAATWGRSGDGARRNLSHMFATLLRYPAFSDPLLCALADPATVERMRHIATLDPGAWGALTIDEAAKFYFEVRDALPGATLAPGSVTDTTGKGEGKATGDLRGLEDKLARGTAVDPEEAAGTLMKLLDAEALARVPARVGRDQAISFALTVAQAFPRLLAYRPAPPGEGDDMDTTPPASVAEALVGQLVAAGVLADDPELRRQVLEAVAQAAGFPVPPPGGKRPKIETFCAGIGQGPHGMRIEFTDRPAGSVRDGTTMGDHTTAFVLVGDAISGRLAPGGDLPTNDEIANSVDEILNKFKPDHFARMLGLRISEVPTWDEFRTGKFDDHKHAVLIKRLAAFNDQWDVLKDRMDKLYDEDKHELSPAELLSIAEEVAALIDQRPTAVVYAGGLATGHGEAIYRKMLDDGEASGCDGCEDGCGGCNPIMILPGVLGLFDFPSASQGLDGFPEGPRRTAFLNRLIDEFLWFLRGAYPHLADRLDEEELRGEIRDRILDPPERGDLGAPVGGGGTKRQNPEGGRSGKSPQSKRKSK